MRRRPAVVSILPKVAFGATRVARMIADTRREPRTQGAFRAQRLRTSQVFCSAARSSPVEIGIEIGFLGTCFDSDFDFDFDEYVSSA